MRSLSFEVSTAILRPAASAAGKIVLTRRNSGEFIITSSPVSGSRKKLPLIPCTEGGVPVTIAELFTFVYEGRQPSHSPPKPCAKRRSVFGIAPAAIAASK